MFLPLGIEKDLVNPLNHLDNMRILFNHGLTSSELFTGSDLQFLDRDTRWFQNNLDIHFPDAYGYFSYIFLYSLDLIITKIITERKRFNGPFKLFYIDFEMFMDDEFMKHRRLGRFKDIDIIESDFKGYQLTFFYRNTVRDILYRSHNFYVGKKHKEMLLELINSGERLYTIEDFTLKDIMPEIEERFPRLKREELLKILRRGYFRMYYSVLQNCYLTFNSELLDFTCFVGSIYKDIGKQFRDYSFRMRMKLMKIAKWRGDKFDQYYYIGISDSRMDDWVALNNKSNRAGWRWVHFEDVTARRQRDAVMYNAPQIYIFRVKIQKKYSKKWNHKIDKAKYRDVEYVGKGNNYTFEPAMIHWKELIKEWNEKGDS